MRPGNGTRTWEMHTVVTGPEDAMAVQVRDAVPADMAGCHFCLDAVAREGRWLSRLQAAPLERYAAFWNSLREARAPQVVALDGDTVVGWCDVIPDTSPVRSHVGRLGIGVLATHRGRGWAGSS